MLFVILTASAVLIVGIYVFLNIMFFSPDAVELMKAYPPDSSVGSRYPDKDKVVSIEYKFKNDHRQIVDLDELPVEIFQFLEVFKNGAKKHGNLNFLKPNGSTTSHKDMHNSMFHHLAESYSNNRNDRDSGFDPLLHVMCRAAIAYTRIKCGIKHHSD